MHYEINPPDFNPAMEVSACFAEHNGRFVLLLRGDSKHKGNTWCLPGGKKGPDEQPLDAAVREVCEETGHLLPKNNIKRLCSVKVRYPEFDLVYNVFRAQISRPPEIRIDKKDHKEHRWVTIEEALKLPLTPPLKHVIETFCQGK